MTMLYGLNRRRLVDRFLDMFSFEPDESSVLFVHVGFCFNIDLRFRARLSNSTSIVVVPGRQNVRRDEECQDKEAKTRERQTK